MAETVGFVELRALRVLRGENSRPLQEKTMGITLCSLFFSVPSVFLIGTFIGFRAPCLPPDGVDKHETNFPKNFAATSSCAADGSSGRGGFSVSGWIRNPRGLSRARNKHHAGNFHG